MTSRVLDLTERSGKLSLKHRQLVVSLDDGAVATAPVEEIGVVVGTNPHVVYTQAALAALLECGGALVACDANHRPVGMMLPLIGHHLQVERFRQQATASRSLCKRLWRQVVRAKIGAQSALLSERLGDDRGIGPSARRVKSGDPDNVEAQAARKYWLALFGDDFRRDREAEDVNRLLNYGYAVLRAMTGRAICAAGLHPSVGIHHRNRYSSFSLADDLMEPFRVLIDRAVCDLLDLYGKTVALDRGSKKALIEACGARVCVEGEWRTAFDAQTRLASTLAQAFQGERNDLLLPERWWET